MKFFGLIDVAGKNRCPDDGYCFYAADYMLSLLSALSAEIEGVKHSDDIEYVHRCRVATRRLRAAMPVFEECFSPKDYDGWMKRIKAVTRSLGEARDLDVQIDFLKGFLDAGTESPGPVFFSLEDPAHAAGAVHTETDVTRTDIIPAVPSGAGEEQEEDPPKRGIRGFFSRLFSGRRKKREVIPGAPEEVAVEPAGPAYYQGSPDPDSPGIECLITRLEQKRREIQPGVIKSMEAFERSGTVDKMGAYLREIKVKSEMLHTDIHSPYAFEKAFYNISLSTENLFWYEKFLPDPALIRRHHEMRISAKRFRYTLETYSGLYEDGLEDKIKPIKKLQDYLGDMHDCDVWAEFLERFIAEERERTRAFFGNDRFFDFILPGLTRLREDRAAGRSELYTELVKYWDTLKEEKFWDELRSVISVPLQCSYHHLIDSSNADETLKIALIGDVHANLPALEAVLSDAKERGASAIMNTGDFVGYGAFPDSVVSMMRDEHIISVIGNYDLSVLKFKKKKRKGLPKNRQKRFAMKWAYRELSPENKRYLASLPKQIQLNLKDSSIFVTHGSPDSIREYIDENTRDEKLRSYLAETGADFIVTGHSHAPFAKEIDGKWFINTGSVGRPDDGDPRACYAMLCLNPFSLYHVRVPYDVERAVEEIYKKNLPDSFARIFREGRPLDIIMHSDEDISS